MTADLISVNEKTVLSGSMPWRNELLQNRIDILTRDSQFIQSFNITIGNSYTHNEVPSDVINGLLERILMQDIHPDGFKSITFS